jgi:hypothetical protein
MAQAGAAVKIPGTRVSGIGQESSKDRRKEANDEFEYTG